MTVAVTPQFLLRLYLAGDYAGEDRSWALLTATPAYLQRLQTLSAELAALTDRLRACGETGPIILRVSDEERPGGAVLWPLTCYCGDVAEYIAAEAHVGAELTLPAPLEGEDWRDGLATAAHGPLCVTSAVLDRLASFPTFDTLAEPVVCLGIYRGVMRVWWEAELDYDGHLWTSQSVALAWLAQVLAEARDDVGDACATEPL